MKSLMALAFLAVLFCCTPSWEAQSQHLPASATGKYYLVSFPRPLDNLYDIRFPNAAVANRQDFYIYSEHATIVTITLPDGSAVSYDLIAGEFRNIRLPATAFSPTYYVDQTGAISNSVYKVRSRRPILLQCVMSGQFGMEAWTPLPVESWGNEYYVSAIPSETVVDITPYDEFALSSEVKGAPSQIIITAARNNTTVLVEPNDEVAGSGSDPFTIDLDAGESYMIRSEADPDSPGSHDLGGTRILSTKIIGVLSGNTRASGLDDPVMISGNSIRNLMLEALAPVEQHGTEFVFMPTWDDRRQRPGLPTDEDRGNEYVRVYGSSAGTTFGTTTDDLGNLDPFSVGNADFHSAQFSTPTAHLIRTDQPAQAMMNSSAVVKFNGTTTGYGSFIGANYLSWSPYMVELTPREQWPNSAAFIAPPIPLGMDHYVNLVAPADDKFNVYYTSGNSSPQLFLFNRGTIPGTDLVWGTMELTPETTYLLEGENGARFAGFVYGNWRGLEEYRPAGTKDNGKEHSTQSAHPSEYQEFVGLYYGYPISPRRRVLNDPDVTSITTDNEENEADGGKTYRISISSDDASGIRSIDLSSESINTKIEIVDMEDEMELIGISEVRVRLSPIDPTQDASATLIVTDRTESQTSAPYEYAAKVSGVTGDGRAVGSVEIVGPNPTAGFAGILLSLVHNGEVRVTITNALGQPVATLADRTMAAGEHLLEWDAAAVPAGVYFCTVTSAGTSTIERIIVR